MRRTLPNRNYRSIYSGFLARNAQVLFDRRFVWRKQTRAFVAQDCGTESVCALRSVRLVEQLRRRDAGLRIRREQTESAGTDQERATSVLRRRRFELLQQTQVISTTSTRQANQRAF